MNRSFKPVRHNLTVLAQRSQQAAELPSLTIYKMSFAYLNNDWTLIFSSLLTLCATLITVAMQFSK